MRSLLLTFLVLAAGNCSFAAAVTSYFTISGTGSGFTNSGGVNDPATNMAFNNQPFTIILFPDPNSFVSDLLLSAAVLTSGQLTFVSQSGAFAPGPPVAFASSTLFLHGDGFADAVDFLNEDPLNTGTLQELLLSGSGFDRQLIYNAFGPVDATASLLPNLSNTQTFGEFGIQASFGLVEFSNMSNVTFDAVAAPEPVTSASMSVGVLLLAASASTAQKRRRS